VALFRRLAALWSKDIAVPEYLFDGAARSQREDTSRSRVPNGSDQLGPGAVQLPT
jgi:hypothetical protein